MAFWSEGSATVTININLDLNTPSQLATHNETSSQWKRRLGSLGDLKPVPHTLQTRHIPCKPDTYLANLSANTETVGILSCLVAVAA